MIVQKSSSNKSENEKTASSSNSNIAEHLFPFYAKEQATQKPSTLLSRFFHKSTEPREVCCFNCGKIHTTNQMAQAAHCPSCGTHITLRNFEINEPFHRSIHTQGDVTIGKKASLLGGVMECRNLTIEGPFRGSAKCSGTIYLHHDNRINGHLTCHHFHIPRNVKIESVHPIVTHSAVIEGELHNSIVATGLVTLEKNASLHGDILASSVVIKPGAKHHGLISIQQVTLTDDA